MLAYIRKCWNVMYVRKWKIYSITITKKLFKAPYFPSLQSAKSKQTETDNTGTRRPTPRRRRWARRRRSWSSRPWSWRSPVSLRTRRSSSTGARASSAFLSLPGYIVLESISTSHSEQLYFKLSLHCRRDLWSLWMFSVSFFFLYIR